MELKELADLLQGNGIAGAGGAGFPTYAKLDKRADTIILNCAECEPLLKLHRQLLQRYPYEIMSTLTLLAETVGAVRVIIAVKGAYKKTIEAVQAHIESFSNIELRQMDEVYPLGDEVVLIYETLGKVVPPGGLPIEVGVTVFNVETIYNIYRGVYHQIPVTDKYLTIAGEVVNPITVRVPIGLSVEEAVELAGGSTLPSPVYIMGGPMTGNIVRSYDTVTKTTNAILVLPADHFIVRKKQTNTSIDMKRAMSVCCQCEMCTDLCPRHELGQPIAPHRFMRAATSGSTQDLEPFLDTMFCCGCGVCEMYACPQELSPRLLISEYKSGLRKNGINIPKGKPLKEVSTMREYRKIPMERLTTRLNLKIYDIAAPITETIVQPRTVKINLCQNIGVKSKPIVYKNDYVKQGELIAVHEEGKLSLPVHASIEGYIQEVHDNFIIIKKSSE
jgi:Na+-translocating ferredoxin:NAD+ oxidoreductase RnfC subunit